MTIERGMDLRERREDAEGRRRELHRLGKEYEDLPPEALLKEDLLRLGVGFSEDALRCAAESKLKSYFIFSFDMVPIAEMERAEHLRVPEEIRFSGGEHAYRPTVVSVRVNPGSPYRVEVRDGVLVLAAGPEALAAVELPAIPEHYRRSLASGQPAHEVAPTIEWGYLIYLTVYRKCQYFGFQEECRFCDINENYRQQQRAGRPYRTVKPLEELLEALGIIAETDSAARCYTLTGGSIKRSLRGETESEFYASYARAIEERFPGRWISKVVAQALPVAEQQAFKDAGVRIYHPNYEVWDARLFEILCPGKAAHVGREEWLTRILAAREVFGAENVIPNFVAGIEMARPHGFESVDDAIASTGEGLEWFMSRGVCPRYTVWCPEPLSDLVRSRVSQGKAQRPAPLEYHAALLRTWRDTHRRHRLPVPPGYGPPGPGRALFSVSSFMDVIEA